MPRGWPFFTTEDTEDTEDDFATLLSRIFISGWWSQTRIGVRLQIHPKSLTPDVA